MGGLLRELKVHEQCDLCRGGLVYRGWRDFLMMATLGEARHALTPTRVFNAALQIKSNIAAAFASTGMG
ncbi:hypothetical protein AO260_25610, partial [Pseudomonas sp. ABAC21]